MPVEYGEGKAGRWRFSVYESGTNSYLGGGTPKGFETRLEARQGLERLKRELLGRWHKLVAVFYGIGAGAAICLVYMYFTFGE